MKYSYLASEKVHDLDRLLQAEGFKYQTTFEDAKNADRVLSASVFIESYSKLIPSDQPNKSRWVRAYVRWDTKGRVSAHVCPVRQIDDEDDIAAFMSSVKGLVLTM